MTFQASDSKGNQFLNLLDDNFNIIELFYAKEGSWLQLFGHSNLLLWNALDINIFLFLLSIFLDFIFLFL